jgi:predicted membrane protein
MIMLTLAHKLSIAGLVIIIIGLLISIVSYSTIGAMVAIIGNGLLIAGTVMAAKDQHLYNIHPGPTVSVGRGRL